jgi:hypothetical protein
VTQYLSPECKIVDMFEEVHDQKMRDCRSESLQLECQGRILQCEHCKENGVISAESFSSTVHLSNMELESLKKRCISLDSHIGCITNEIELPLSRERCDLMTFCYSVDQDGLNSGFFHDCLVCDIVATRRMNDHDWEHRASYFKYEKACRFPFSKKASDFTTFEEDKDDRARAQFGDF